MKIIKRVAAIIGAMILAITSYLLLGVYRFKKRVKQELAEMVRLGQATPEKTFRYEDAAHLPEPVQRYLKYAIPEGQPYIQFARLKQDGIFRTERGEDWMPLLAEQFYTADPPAFIWHANALPVPLMWIEARDKYMQGQGHMLVKLFSVWSVVDIGDREMAISNLLRFLAEAVWYPTVLAQVEWTDQGPNSAKATLRDNGLAVSATFYFDETGEITHCITEERYRTVEEGYSHQDRWIGYYRAYREINNVKVPTEVEVAWDTAAGGFSYAQIALTEVEYNNPAGFES